MLAYLCGPIDLTGESDRLWRRKLAPFLRDHLGHRVYDLSEEARKGLTNEEVANFRAWQKTDLDRFRRVARKIIATSLDLIEHKADYMVCHWDAEDRESGGTPAELAAAFRKGIPIYLVTGAPVEQVSTWALGCSDQVFSSIESLKEFLVSRFSREKQTHLWQD